MSEVGLVFPEDLEAWRMWSDSRNRVRFALSAARRRFGGASVPVKPMLYLPVEEPRVLVVLDQVSASCRYATFDPLAHLDPKYTAVLSHHPEAREAATGAVRVMEWHRGAPLPRSIEQILTLGAFNGLAADVRQWAVQRDVRFCVIQHGLLTPWSPPLSSGDHLFAWSDADEEYQRAGRSDVTSEVVGSQMLWKASLMPTVDLIDETPVMLGQLHGSELGRLAKQRIYTDFCIRNGATYRPHPNEADALSRAQHRLMQRAGVVFERFRGSLVEQGRPVVSIFSTGTLEIACRGLPAWVHHPAPPAWVKAFWHRYGLSPWGSEPTQPLPQPEKEPAQVVAEALMGRAYRIG
ncbi:prephenate dehydrogenase [Cutibacterium sp. WCA-380-WT-3A]|uniref:Prephenate dehydrogenase n=1 Tax=Cutibacterium porci TaxID=2605781 RepID=A0A7K0J4I8_9ACTN|nr:prephenate dehydrogenase [Cutibacterium porci]MSS44851.1 prephenate dehydrogenase [Cutibacterium porci]